MHHEGLDELLKRILRVVSVSPVPPGDEPGERHEPGHVGPKTIGEDLPLAGADDLRPAFSRPAKRRLRLAEGIEAVRADHPPGDAPEEVVAGRAGAGPGLGQLLPRLQDLLHDDPRGRGPLPQRCQVRPRLAQTIDVIEPKPGDMALVDQTEHQPVGVLEELRVLHAQPHQGVDIEEPPVVELLAAGLPVAKPIVLSFDERVEAVEVPVQELELRQQRVSVSRLIERPVQQAVQYDLLPMPRPHAVPVVREQLGQPLEPGGDEPELITLRALPRRPQEVPERPGGRWIGLLVVPDDEARVRVQLHPQLLCLHDPARVVPEHGNQDPVVVAVRSIPVDVEVASEPAGRAVFEHVPPPAVLRGADRHVVWDEIHDLGEAARRQRLTQPGVAGLTAQLFADARVVDDIVAVLALWRGLKDRR